MAADILSFVAEDAERLQRFLDLTGLALHTVRRAAAQPGFSESLFDYLCSDDRLLAAFATERRHDPARIEAMRQDLAARNGEAG